jgi:hypothetical protein
MEERRYTPEEALTEAEKMQALVGNHGTKEEYTLSEQIIEDERANDPQLQKESFQKGRVTIILPTPPINLNYTIAFDANTPEEFKLFNTAAREVTHQYHGFHQVGSHYKVGYTAWELWQLPNDAHPYEIVKQIEEKMRELADVWTRLGIIENSTDS